MKTFCLGRGLSVDEWVDEIGDGMNFNRLKFMKLVIEIIQGGIKTLVIAHKNRLARFGFEFVENIAKINNCDIIGSLSREFKSD
jgi:predicted site-specific integrase-resolvase